MLGRSKLKRERKILSTTSGAATGTIAATPARRDFRIPLGPRLLSLFGVVVLASVAACLPSLPSCWCPRIGASALSLRRRVCSRLSPTMVARICRQMAIACRARHRRRYARLAGGAVPDPSPAGTASDRPLCRYCSGRVAARRLSAPSAWKACNAPTCCAAKITSSSSCSRIARSARRWKVRCSPASPPTLAARAGGTVHDIGMVAGKGGVLGVWGTHAPDWAAPPLSAAERLAHWRRAATTGSLVFIIIIVALAIRLLAGG